MGIDLQSGMDARVLVYHRGMWIPKRQIDKWEQEFGGKLVENNQLCSWLEKAAQQFVEKRHRVPGMMKIREMPFKYYFPVRVVAENVLGIADVPTNKFIFIERRRLF